MHHKNYRLDKTCLNCSAIVERRFCPECGQENIEVREPFLSMVGHFFSDYFHFDSKFFRSLVLLIFKPGFLTKQFWEGKRTRYIHPLRFFFFITIVFMICMTMFYHKFGEDFKNRIMEDETELSRLDTASWLLRKSSDRIYLSSRNDSLTIAALRSEINENNRQLGQLRSGFDDVFKNLKYISFLMLPIYAVVFSVLYPQSGKYYSEHVVYTMHVQSFMYFLFSITLALPFIFPLDIDAVRHISLWTMITYIWISLHVLYKQAWWLTTVKTFFAAAFVIFSTQFIIIFFAYAFR